MDAGRELDALVAEHVMRFQRWVYSYPTSDGKAILIQPSEYVDLWRKTGMDEVGPVVELSDTQSHVPHYSTDIAAAMPIFDQHTWILVREAARDGYRYAIYEDWRALEDGIALATAPTAATVICLAALADIGYPVDQELC